MSRRRYQKTLNRYQDMLLPERVEEYVSENNRVRAIDVYVNTLKFIFLSAGLWNLNLVCR